MKPEIRQKGMLSRLRAIRQEIKIDDFSKALGVSDLTIRRDLDALTESGVIVRTHGGAIAVTRLQNADYVKQVASNFDDKEAIGFEAIKEVKRGDVLLLNDGSTIFHLASCLGQLGKLTIYTNSIAMISEFNRFPDIRVYVLGGEYHSNIFCLGGTMTARALDGIMVDTVFVGTDAIDASGRCLVKDRETADTARVMLLSARRKILLADATKVNAEASVVYGNLSDFDLWITSSSLQASDLQRLKKFTKIRVACARQ